MSKQSYSDQILLHEQISLRNEYTRFACMFYFFTLLAFLIGLSLLILANDSYQNESQMIQRRFIPYSILGSISSILFFVFFLGSLVYTKKLCRFNAQTKNDKLKPLQSLIVSSSTFVSSKSRTTPCQTDV